MHTILSLGKKLYPVYKAWALKKMAGIGQKRLYENEVKKDYTVKLTPTAAKQLSDKAQLLNTSRSQLVEMFARGEITEDIYRQILGEPLAS